MKHSFFIFLQFIVLQTKNGLKWNIKVALNYLSCSLPLEFFYRLSLCSWSWESKGSSKFTRNDTKKNNYMYEQRLLSLSRLKIVNSPTQKQSVHVSTNTEERSLKRTSANWLMHFPKLLTSLRQSQRKGISYFFGITFNILMQALDL